MFLSFPKVQLKSILSSRLCPYGSALPLRRPIVNASFATLPSRSAASKPPSKAPPVQARPTTPPPNAAEMRERQRSLLAQKSIQDGQAMLFRAHSHTGYMSAAWIAGAMCLSGALLIFNLKLHEANNELHWLVPIAYRVSGVFLVMVGSWSILRSSRLVSSIEVLRRNGKAMLLFKVRRNIPLPFIKPKEMIVDASDVVLHRRMVLPMGPPPDLRSSTGIPSQILAAPHRFFAGTRQFILSDGIVKISVTGRGGLWKVDSNGWFLDGGNRLFELANFDS
jgi:hypothetical protein